MFSIAFAVPLDSLLFKAEGKQAINMIKCKPSFEKYTTGIQTVRESIISLQMV